MATQGFSWGGGGQVVWLPQVADSKNILDEKHLCALQILTY